MVGEMTVVSIMHKVRVCARHLCKLRSANGWRREINENAHLRAESSASSLQSGFRKDSEEKPRQANQRKLDPYLLQTIFMSQYTHCLHREGQLIHKANGKKKKKMPRLSSGIFENKRNFSSSQLRLSQLFLSRHTNEKMPVNTGRITF